MNHEYQPWVDGDVHTQPTSGPDAAALLERIADRLRAAPRANDYSVTVRITEHN